MLYEHIQVGVRPPCSESILNNRYIIHIVDVLTNQVINDFTNPLLTVCVCSTATFYFRKYLEQNK